jgi:hypothetical protein
MAELRVKGTGTIKLFESDNTSSVTIASPASLSANKTITLPDADVTLASGTMLATDGSGASLTALNASELGSGTVPTARLGSGTASSSTVLYGDQTYKTEPGLTGWSVDGGNNDLLPASASAGIYLGVSSATAANLLDDYEEGTWTAAPENTTATGGNLVGFYTKVGNLVNVAIYITTALTSSSGSARCLGLPFVAKQGSDPPVYVSTGGIGYNDGSIDGYAKTIYFWDNQSRFTATQAASNAAGAWVDNASTELAISGTYMTA